MALHKLTAEGRWDELAKQHPTENAGTILGAKETLFDFSAQLHEKKRTYSNNIENFIGTVKVILDSLSILLCLSLPPLTLTPLPSLTLTSLSLSLSPPHLLPPLSSLLSPLPLPLLFFLLSHVTLKIPIGIAGPLHVKGTHSDKSYLIPLATTGIIPYIYSDKYLLPQLTF
jgi:hypothetical protein